MNEPNITINGVQITDSMSMTLRVSLEAFASDLCEHGLGDDEHGKTMVQLYRKRIDEIRQCMYK